MRAIAEYLLTVDLTNWNSRNFPITEVKTDVMDLSASAEKQMSLFEQYKEECSQDKKKNIVGKTDFYKQFEKYFGLSEAVQIKYKNDFNIETKIRGYRHFVLKNSD